MNYPILLLLLLLHFSLLTTKLACFRAIQPPKLNAHITVLGFVYCDVCSNNTFSPHSYFLPGAEVRIDCKYRASSQKTREEVLISVNRTTNSHGLYRLEIPSVDGISCSEAAMASCQATLLWSSSKSCNVPGYKSTADEFAIVSKQANLCFYSLSALNFRTSSINNTLCGH